MTLAFKQPTPLPLEIALEKVSTLDSSDLSRVYRNASKKARKKLQRQKSWTGVAILGSPCEALRNDPKFQGDFLEKSVAAGEELAQASLSAEYFILNLAGIPPGEMYRYIGRGQYPSFRYKPLAPKKGLVGKYVCPHLQYWTETLTLVQSWALDFQNTKRSDRFYVHIKNIYDHLEPGMPYIEFHPEANPPDLEIWINKLKNIQNHFLKKSIFGAIQAFDVYVRQECAKGGGKLFQWISREEKAFLSIDLSKFQKGRIDPDAFVNKQASEWKQFWAPLKVDPNKVALLLNKIREFLVDGCDRSILLEFDSFVKSVKTYKKNTRGSDNWGPKEIASLPEIACKPISNAENVALSNFVVPHQQLLNLNAVLGKPKGVRTVSKTPVLYRMWARSEDNIPKWEKHNAGSFDSAVKGWSATRAATLRSLIAEVAQALGIHAGCALNDFHKFFDSIEVEKLLEKALECDFPLPELLILMYQHLAPRVIQLQGTCSDPIQIHNSILQGCRFSGTLTRVLLVGELKTLIESNRDTLITSHIDDIPIHATGSKSDVYNQLLDAEIEFSAMCKRLNLTLADKANLVTSDSRLTKRLISGLKKKGVSFKFSSCARDLGLPYTAGVSRIDSNHLIRKRFSTTSCRNRRIGIIAKKTKKARVLFSGSLYSANTHGHHTVRLTNAQLEALEKRGAQATGINQEGRCRFFALVCAYGPRGHPVARIIKDIFTSWFLALEDIKKESSFLELRTAWSKIKQELLRENVNVLLANRHGLIHNVITWLLRLKWNPIAIDVWIHPDGSKWELSRPSHPPVLFIQAIVDSYNILRVKKASTHRNAKGIEEGVDYSSTFALSRAKYFRNNVSRMAALDTILAAATWPLERVNECYPEVSSVCPRCLNEPETDFHTYWSCPCNGDIEDKEVVDTQCLIPEARNNYNNMPCLWLRGILPAACTTAPDISAFDRKLCLEGPVPRSGFWPSGKYYGDGSGGEFSAFPTLRQCGVSVVSMNGTELAYGIHYRLPGTIQTVPRAELSALATLVEMVSEDAHITYICDNLPMVKMYGRGREACTRFLNFDLWDIVFGNIARKHITIEVKWMPSHLDTMPHKERPEWVTELDIIGNAKADELADFPTKYTSQARDLNIINEVIRHTHLVRRIQARLACILCNLPSRAKVKRIVKPPRRVSSLDELITVSQHAIANHNGFLRCAMCKQGTSCKNKDVRGFVSSPCVPIIGHSHCSVRLLSVRRIGSKITHPSHALFSYRGLIYCQACGYMANKMIRELSKPCTRVKTAHAERVLDCISKDRLPLGVQEWPDSCNLVNTLYPTPNVTPMCVCVTPTVHDAPSVSEGAEDSRAAHS